jgi:hypothetical protein
MIAIRLANPFEFSRLSQPTKRSFGFYNELELAEKRGWILGDGPCIRNNIFNIHKEPCEVRYIGI